MFWAILQTQIWRRKNSSKKKELDQWGGQTTALHHLLSAIADGTCRPSCTNHSFIYRSSSTNVGSRLGQRYWFSPWNWSLKAITGTGVLITTDGGWAPAAAIGLLFPDFIWTWEIKLKIKWAAHKLQSSLKRAQFSASVMCVLETERRTLESNSHFLKCVEGSEFVDEIETILPSLRFPIFFSRYVPVPALSLSLHRSCFTWWFRSQLRSVHITHTPLWGTILALLRVGLMIPKIKDQDN